MGLQVQCMQSSTAECIYFQLYLEGGPETACIHGMDISISICSCPRAMLTLYLPVTI